MPFSKLLVLGILSFIGCNSSESQKTKELHPKPVLVENPVSEDSLFLNKSTGVTYYQNQPFTGRAISKYDNDSLALLIEYVNGKKDGCYKKFFPNGELSYDATYTNGKLNGKSRTWWSNGKLRTESSFTDGVPDGIQLQYYKPGLLFKKINLAMGKEEGLQQSWRENGKLYNNYEAKNGRIYGLKRSKLCYKLEDEEIQD